MNRLLKSRDYFMKCLGFVLLFGFISLGAIGGCNNNSGSGELDAVTVGAQSPGALGDISAEINIAPYSGELNNILLDGTNLQDLTDDEKGIIRDAYQNGFIIMAYDMNDARIAKLYKDVLQHPVIYAQNEEIDIPEGTAFAVFTIEQHDGIDWTSIGQFGCGDVMSEELTVEFASQGFASQTRQDETSCKFVAYGLYFREWIEAQEDRRAELELTGLLQGNASEVLNNFEMMDDFEEELEAVTRVATTSGNITTLAKAYIQTKQLRVAVNADNSIQTAGFNASAPHINTYQMTTKAWIATIDTLSGTFAFLFVNQDFNLASSNGFVVNSSTDEGTQQQAWYLSEYKNVNTLSVGGTDLTFPNATLLDNKPETNQATTATTTVSVSTSLTGSAGISTIQGPEATVGGGISWSTSTTFSKANVSINNLSLSERTDLGNDASWQYFPRKAEIDTDDCDDSIFNLADLAHETFTPSQGFIYQIDGSFAGQTLTLNTVISISMTNTYLCNCGFCFGAKSCDACQQNVTPGSGQGTFTQLINIPAAP